MVASSARSTTGRNLLGIQRETGLDPLRAASWEVREAVGRAEVPPMQGWRVQYLGKLLDARREMDNKCEETDEVSSLIDALCSS